MIAFDSNILIYILENDSYFADKARKVFLDVQKDGGVCSALVITETLYSNITRCDQLGPLLSPSITIAPVTQAIAELAGQLKIKYGIKNIDAIHVATALNFRAKVFVTNDLPFAQKISQIIPTKTLADF